MTLISSNRGIVAIAAATLGLAAFAPSVHAHEGDIGLSFLGGRLVTGIVIIPGPGTNEFVTPGQRTFAGEFADVSGSIYSADPGFFSGPLLGQSAPALPANSSLRFNILGSLMRWDSVAGNFSAVTPGERLRIEFAAGALSRTSSMDGSNVSGFGFDTGATGGFDEHFDYYLDAAAGQTAPAAGIYAIGLDLFIDGLAGSNSLPYYTVFNFDSPEADHDAAIEYVNSNIVPSPSGVAALVGAGLIAMRRRRR